MGFWCYTQTSQVYETIPNKMRQTPPQWHFLAEYFRKPEEEGYIMYRQWSEVDRH